jgi:hypothetical protein
MICEGDWDRDEVVRWWLKGKRVAVGVLFIYLPRR